MSAYGKAQRSRRTNRPTPLAPKHGRTAASPSSSSSSSSRRPRVNSHLVFNHALGQHILKNPLVVKSIMEKAAVRPTDTVLEVGPGTGNLTVKLLEAGKKVIVVEYDVRMIAELQKRVAGTEHAHKLQIIHGDVLKVELPYFDICVANLPYQISSPFTFRLLARSGPQQQQAPFRCAVLMYQREFAQRLTASPSSPLYCRLSLNTQLLSRVEHLLSVSRNSFRPPPKVDSSVVRIQPIHPQPDVDFSEWDGLVRLCFTRKNRTLRAIFNNKKIIDLLAANHGTFRALQQQQRQPPASTPFPSPAVADHKSRILGVLESLSCSGKRASKMAQTEFLTLLARFNEEGYHFTASGMGAEGMEDEADEEEEEEMLDMGIGDEDEVAQD